MKWWKLRSNQCPKPGCNGQLAIGGSETRPQLACDECSFKISEEKMQKIVGDLNKRSFDAESRGDDHREDPDNWG